MRPTYSLQSTLLSFFFILTLGATVKAQIFVKALEIGNGPTNCDAIVEVSSINVPLGLILYTQYSDTFAIGDTINHIDTLYNVCDTNVGGSFLPYDNYVGLYHPNPPFNGNIIIAGIFPPGLDYTFSNYVAPSNPVAEDGEITIVFTQPIIPNPIFGNEMFTHGFSSSDAIVQTTDNQTFHVSGIAEGMFRGNFNLPGGSYPYQIAGYIGDPTVSSINNNLSVTLDVNDGTNGCNGTATIQVDAMATGVTYLWNEISYNGLSSVDSLCPGYYTVLIQDDNGDNALVNFVISDFQMDYWTPWNNINLPMDTIQFTMSNCNIDFFAPVDSVTWTENNYLSVGDTSFYEFELHIYQDTNAFTFIDSFYLTSDTLVYLACGIYCESFKKVSFDGFKIFLAHDGTQKMNDIRKLQKPIVHYFPNPANNKLFLVGTTEALLYDQVGRFTQKLRSGENDISELTAGFYFVISPDQGHVGKLVVE
jgi:hypothetical protein